MHLKGASNVIDSPIARDTGVAPTLEQRTPDELLSLGIKSVNKMKVLNLPSIGYIPSDKPEGLAFISDSQIAVLNDNDFGIEESTGLIPVLGIITFDDGNRLDASNRDGAINIRNWPVFGIYQTDAIDAYEVDGMSFYVTANEGDARDFDFFSEEARCTLPLQQHSSTLLSL